MARFSFSSERQCPHCLTVALKELEVKKVGIKIDQCPKCKGIWFDASELDRVLGGAEDLASVSGKTLSACKCPSCQTNAMSQVTYPETMVQVDVCNHCQGVWLDGGEFDEIKTVIKQRRVAAQQQKMAAQPMGIEPLGGGDVAAETQTQASGGQSKYRPLDVAYEGRPPKQVRVPEHLSDECERRRGRDRYDRDDYQPRRKTKRERFFDVLEDVFEAVLDFH